MDNEQLELIELGAAVARLTENAKNTRAKVWTLASLTTLDAATAADRMALLGADFTALAARMRESSRRAADASRLELGA